jgi:hypothetical protein
MALTRIQRGMLETGAVIVPDNLYTTNTASNSLFLRGDGSWQIVDNLSSTSSITIANLTVTNQISFGDAGPIKLGPTKVFIGENAGETTNTNYDYQIAIGAGAGYQVVEKYRATGGGSGEYISGAISIGSNYKDENLNPGQSENDIRQRQQGADAISIGSNAANWNQGEQSIALGLLAGHDNLGQFAVSIGPRTWAGDNGVAIGHNAIASSSTIALGAFSGSGGEDSIVIGHRANPVYFESSLGSGNVIIGSRSGQDYSGAKNNIGDNNILIGQEVGIGPNSPYTNSILIGKGAGNTFGDSAPASYSIILNATGEDVNSEYPSLYIAPLRASTSSYVMFYNPSSYEVTYAAPFDPDQGVLP